MTNADKPDMGAAELAAIRASVERLEKAVNRFCVVAERMLSSHEHNQSAAAKALAGLHPKMKLIQAEVAAKNKRMGR